MIWKFKEFMLILVSELYKQNAQDQGFNIMNIRVRKASEFLHDKPNYNCISFTSS